MENRHPDSSVDFIGQWEVTVLDDGRIKLPCGLLTTLKSIQQPPRILYPGRIPLSKALVLCPGCSWDRWKEYLVSMYPKLKTLPGASAFCVPMKPVRCDDHGRMSLPSLACNHAGIKNGLPIVFVGKNYYIELWSEEEFNRAIVECEAVSRTHNQESENGLDKCGEVL